MYIMIGGDWDDDIRIHINFKIIVTATAANR
jgi:hypothetical protein